MTPPVRNNLDEAGYDPPLEARLSHAGATLRYPPTPDIAGAVRARLDARGVLSRPGLLPRLSPAALALAALAVTIGAAAGVLRLGAVTFLLPEPTQEGETEVPVTAAPSGRSGMPVPVTATPAASPSPLLQLAGRTTLEAAREQADFPILLPTYPSSLGEPDLVFYQEFGGQIVVLAWLAEDDPNRVVMSLHILGPGTFALKGPVGEIEQASVNGTLALWTTGPYMLVYEYGEGENPDFRYLVEGHVLVWQQGGITYRLETGLSKSEAVKIAESLR